MSSVEIMLLPIFIGVPLALAIIKFFYKDTILPFNSAGKIERIPHYDKEDNIENNKKKRNLIQDLRINKLIAIKQEVEANHKQNFKEFLPTVSAVCGELKDLTWISKALALNFSVDLIIGNKIWNDKQKAELLSLMEEYPNELNVFLRKTRPNRHTQKIGNLIVIEDSHPPEGTYEFATVLTNPKKDIIKSFGLQFNEFKTEEKASINNIKDLGTYVK
jgi:hypothetical protein